MVRELMFLYLEEAFLTASTTTECSVCPVGHLVRIGLYVSHISTTHNIFRMLKQTQQFCRLNLHVHNIILTNVPIRDQNKSFWPSK